MKNKKTTYKKKTVFVGVSGGVDSAVSATLLKEQQYDVIGVFIRTWHPEWLTCNEEEERMDAMRICAHLNIPFLTFDLENVYKKEVADYMIREYRAGRTPNPDVMCNREVKFGAFMKKAFYMGADYVATGHYAKIKKESSFLNGLAEPLGLGARRTEDLKKRSFPFLLEKGIDPAKDQSYFLWTLKQEQLSKIIFPIGHLKKIEVRKLAQKFKLPVAEKKDSQGICFLGQVDLKDFLKHYIPEKKGKVYNEKKEEIGYHEGAIFYTLGERHGFTINRKNPNDGPYYVVGKDIKKNILYVSQDKNCFQKSPDIFLLKNSSRLAPSRSVASFGNSSCLYLKDVNWIFPFNFQLSTFNLFCQIRYHGEFLPCQLEILSKNSAKVILKEPILVASGQSCVVYDGDICLGGGIII